MSSKYHVVCYRRLECPASPMTWGEAARERECLLRSHPENFYVIEEVSP